MEKSPILNFMPLLLYPKETVPFRIYEKENEPKKIAPAKRYFGLPGASRIGRSRWNALALKRPQRLFARFHDASVRQQGKGQTLCVSKPRIMSRNGKAWCRMAENTAPRS